MIIRSKAPLRLGLAGGGTDVKPYCDLYGGAILNATISMYAYATIVPRNDGVIRIHSVDNNILKTYPSGLSIPLDKQLILATGIYNRIVRDYIHNPLSFDLITYVDAPPGSGLGTSSTLVVAILGAFSEWLKIPLGEYDMASLSYVIERSDLGMAGGKQDQYSATFGGVNYMEFYEHEKVIVNPLRVRREYLDELAHNILLYNTKTSRISSEIIAMQSKNVENKSSRTIEAMHVLKEQAQLMKEELLKGNLDRIGDILDRSWQYKKQMADGITNGQIDEIYDTAMRAGASGGKISGAGGGGFMFFYCPGNSRHQVINALENLGGKIKRYEFTNQGLTTWTI